MEYVRDWTTKKDKLLREIVLKEMELNLTRSPKRKMKDIYEIASLALLHPAGSCQTRFNTEIRPFLSDEEVEKYNIERRVKPQNKPKKQEELPEVDTVFATRLKYVKSITQSQTATMLYRNALDKVGDIFESLIDNQLRLETINDSLFADLEEVIQVNTQLIRENEQLKLKLGDKTQ